MSRDTGLGAFIPLILATRLPSALYFISWDKVASQLSGWFSRATIAGTMSCRSYVPMSRAPKRMSKRYWSISVYMAI